MAEELRGRRVAILATDGVEQVELTQPREAVEQAGAQVTLLSIHTGEIQSMNADIDKGDTFTVDRLVSSVRFTGGIGTVGVFIPQDPGGPDELSQQGKVRFDFGNFWFKGQQMGTGQAPIKRYNRHLRNLIAADKVTPSWIVSHNLPLEKAPDAYKHFDAREDGWTKVVLNPGTAA
ncbi:DJ-1/PfpI family protein [Nocardiopsis sp. NPDC006832]|uniref:DJ-1/PfpI family protein n=2 Tax=Nocardiopsidaceae TaxID=83676 RepID=UPI0033C82A52